MNEKVRAFLAVELDSVVIELIQKIQTSLKALPCDIKWVKPSQAHITLKFLGEIHTDKIPMIITLTQKQVNLTEIFSFTTTRLGAFPKLDYPNILWLGVEEKNNVMKTLAEKSNDELVGYGIKKEDKKFNSHITIGRIRSKEKISSLIHELKNYPPLPELSQNVSHITLFKSNLTSAGPIYEALKFFKLKGI